MEQRRTGCHYNLQWHRDWGGSVLLLLLAMSAAFDTVDHDLLTQRYPIVAILLSPWLRTEGCCPSNAHLNVSATRGNPLLSALQYLYVTPCSDDPKAGAGLHWWPPAPSVNGWMDSTPDLDDILQALAECLKHSRLKLNPSKMKVLYLNHWGPRIGNLAPCLQWSTFPGDEEPWSNPGYISSYGDPGCCGYPFTIWDWSGILLYRHPNIQHPTWTTRT